MSTPRADAALRALRMEELPDVGRSATRRMLRERILSHLRALQARALVREELAVKWRRRAVLAIAALIPAAAAGAATLDLAPAFLAWKPAAPPGSPPASELPKPARARGESRLAAPAESAPAAVAEAVGGNPRKATREARAGGPVNPSSPPASATESSGAASFPDELPSTLAEENTLLSRAMAAGRNGDDRKALALADELLRRYPASPLAQNARVERFRALERLGDSAAAAREARRYLSEHPQGMARDEARALAVDPGVSSR